MRRKLSSLQTFIAKILFPGLWTSLFGIMVVRMFLSSVGRPVNWTFLIFWIAGSAFIWWGSARFKVVSVDKNFLYVSNYLKEIAIPLSDIYDVTENVWLNNHPVTIHLKSPSEFGDKIIFMPKVRFSLFSSHPVVKELKRLARSRL